MFEKIDITLDKSLKQAFTIFKPDAVIHLAAESHVDRSIVGPAEFINTNILGTYNLLEASKDLWGTFTEGKKFLHVSTDEVFGSLNPNDQPFTEEHKYYPNSPYSASKASSDLLVRAWAITYGLPAIVTNCSNNYGPWQFPEKFIPVVIFNAIQGNEIPIYGDGGNIRDWLYVDDHVKALLKIVESDFEYTTFNIGANQEISNLKLAELICSILDSMNPRTDSTSYKEQISFVGDRLGHDFRYAINSKKLQEEMGFSIESDLENGITKTVDWYLKNRNWLLSKHNSE
jgi:dTDP-glucose 4,6-dehydratase